MINFPTFQSLASVVKTVQLQVAETQPTATQLPTVGYIGFAEPSGQKVVIEFDHTGKVIGASTDAGTEWVMDNTIGLELMFANLTTAHGALPELMTLSLVGYLSGDKLTLIDAQLVMDGNPSAYWLSVAVLIEMLIGVTCINTAFETAMYTELDFNKPEQFGKAISKVADGIQTLWQCSPSAGVPINVPVLRDPYRIAV